MGEPLSGKPVKKLKKSKEGSIAQYSESELLDDVGLSSLDDVYESLKDEFEQVRKCIGMYISYMNTDAALHLFREIVNNSFDEFSNGKVPFDTIWITFDENTQIFSVEDGGRGIPLAKLKEVCMKKHVSTKYERSDIMKRYAGRNGVGMKVTVALTDFFKITSSRNTVSQSIIFNDGIPSIGDINSLTEPAHGLLVEFKPSEKYLGELHVTSEMIEDYLRRMSYLIPEGLSIPFISRDSNGNKREILYSSKPLSDAVTFISSETEFNPVELYIETADFDIEFAFSYDMKYDSTVIESYCNYVYTTEGGCHETTLIRALCEFFVKEARNLDPNSKYEVTYDDCKKGLVAVVAGWHFNPGFEGQHKSKINNDDFISVGKSCIKKALGDYFQRNNATLRKIIAILRKNVQARLEVNKIKTPKAAKMKSALDYMGINGFDDISDPNYTVASELLIAEGVSAVGAAKNIRNRKFQAVLGVMGVIDNVYTCSLEKILTIPVFVTIIKALGCGIANTFDITKLRYKKIIILVDSDVDGSNIASLLLVFFWRFMPELIKQGYVYKAISPLYTIDTYPIKKFYKGNSWLYSKKELYGVFNNIIANNISIAYKPNPRVSDEVVEMSRDEKMRFLELNSEYLMEYNMLIARTSGHPIILEYAAHYRNLAGKDLKLFKKMIESKFPETNYDILEQSLTGSYEGQSISLLVDDLFDVISRRVRNLLDKNYFFTFYYKNENDKDGVYEETTIAQFFMAMEKLYDVTVLQRFKGLGEAKDSLLFMTTINPKLRRLIRFTVKDAQKVDEMMKMFHGKSENDRKLRRNIIATTDISYADIDN